MSTDSLPFEKVSIADAKKSMDAPAAPRKVGEDMDWRWARKWSPAERLKDATAAWLENLAADIRPTRLPQAYPRIANKLADAWAKPDVCEKLLEELLHDHRGSRSGFPDEVAEDLKKLHQFFSKAHGGGPSIPGLWVDEASRRR